MSDITKKIMGVETLFLYCVREVGPKNIFFVTTGLALICFISQNILEAMVDFLASLVGFPSRLGYIKGVQSVGSWISPLLIAPIFENLLCLLWLNSLFSSGKWMWWKGPLVVAVVAAFFHVLLYFEIRYISIVVDFFVICALIVNARRRAIGFWASALLHSEINFLVLIQLKLG